MVLSQATRLGSVSQLLTILSIFVLVLLLAWGSAKILAHYNRAGASSHGNMELVEAFRISTTQVVEILRIGDRYIAIAVSKDQVEKLGEWGQDELHLENPAGGAGEGMTRPSVFRELLEKHAKKNSESSERS
ncbi:MAG: flagellar biosynthetic protein FliO [Lachnospiraceae bacterium]|nr:flagellar biosynthetic protein FliO [Lachnospiraceae bacterium]